MQEPKEIIGAAIVGPAGAGKDKTTELLLGVLPTINLTPWVHYSVGTEEFRKEAAKHNITLEEFNKRRDEDHSFCPTFDHDTDRASLEYCDEATVTGKPFIITSRMVPALICLGSLHKMANPQKIIRILFTCRKDERIRRIIRREFEKKHARKPTEREIDNRFSEAEDRTMTREALDAVRFKKRYGISDPYDRAYFHSVIDTTGWSLELQVEETCKLIVSHI